MEENDATFHPYFITKTKPQEVLTPGVSIPYRGLAITLEGVGLLRLGLVCCPLLFLLPVVQPLADVIRDYPCQNRKQE